MRFTNWLGWEHNVFHAKSLSEGKLIKCKFVEIRLCVKYCCEVSLKNVLIREKVWDLDIHQSGYRKQISGRRKTECVFFLYYIYILFYFKCNLKWESCASKTPSDSRLFDISEYETFQSSNYLCSRTVRGKMGEVEMEDHTNAGIEVEGILFLKKLDGRQILKFTRVGVSACVAMAMLVLMRCEFWRLVLVGDEGA